MLNYPRKRRNEETKPLDKVSPISKEAIAETRDAESAGIPHYHPIVTEYQYVIAGAADVLETDTKRVHRFRQGDFFVIYPNTHYQMLIKPHSRVLFVKCPGANEKMLSLFNLT